ncbi:hypothetical protein BDR22DRAFT_913662 [Usnea florida]
MQLINALQVALLIASQASAIPFNGSEPRYPNSTHPVTSQASAIPINGSKTQAPSSTITSVPGVTPVRVTPRRVRCGTIKYTSALVQSAFNALTSRGAGPTPTPVGGYPHYYGASDANVSMELNKIAGCQIGQQGFQYYEFPLKDPVFSGGPAGPNRVVALTQRPVARTFTYCLAMTHTGALTPGGFVICNPY